MSGVIYVHNETKMPFGVTGNDSKLKNYADLIGPILTIASSQLNKETGAELIGFDVSGKGGKEIMFHKGKTISLIYVGEKDIEINPAYLRDTVKAFEEELKKRPEIKRKIDSGDIDTSLTTWMKEKGFLDIAPVMKSRSKSISLDDLIRINLEKSTLKPVNGVYEKAYSKLKPKNEELKGIYATLKNGAAETYKMIHGEEPENVYVIVKYNRKIIRLQIE